MLECTSGEFTMILSLLEIIIPDLFLFLIINMCSMFHKGYRCVSWFFGLVLDQSMCRRKLEFNYVVFILICIIPFMLTSNAFKFCTLNSVVQNQFLAVQGSVPSPWSQWALLDKFVMSLVVKRLLTRLI
jgi:hypothetical protein